MAAKPKLSHESIAPIRHDRGIAHLLSRLSERDLVHPLRTICKEHYSTLEDVLGGRRHKTTVRAKQAVVMYLTEHCMMSTTEIGALLCLDHTTVVGIRQRARAKRAAGGM